MALKQFGTSFPVSDGKKCLSDMLRIHNVEVLENSH